MSILKLKPAGKSYLWGGNRLILEFHKESSENTLAETWELSCHSDGLSIIENGNCAGKTLKEYIEEQGNVILGSHCRNQSAFPILIKFIDARDDLSIQVHPDDAYALKNEGQKGKTEMWYVVDCEPDAYVYYGFRESIDEEEFSKRVQDQTLTEVLRKVFVKKGDVLFIEAGMVHAIGKNILVAEIQENSNVTYRIYDYGRMGADGKPRKLDIKKASAVMRKSPIVQEGSFSPHLAACDYFTTDKIFLDGIHMNRMECFAGEESFVHVLILEGTGWIEDSDSRIRIEKGDSLFVPAGDGKFLVEGSIEAIMTRI